MEYTVPSLLKKIITSPASICSAAVIKTNQVERRAGDNLKVEQFGPSQNVKFLKNAINLKERQIIMSCNCSCVII